MTSTLPSAPEHQSTTDRLHPQVWRVAAVVFFRTADDANEFNDRESFAFDRSAGELHASIDSVQWTISGYQLALALTQPLNA
jgi:hypothetical protein